MSRSVETYRARGSTNYSDLTSIVFDRGQAVSHFLVMQCRMNNPFLFRIRPWTETESEGHTLYLNIL